MKLLQSLLAFFAFAFLPLHAASLDDLTYTTTDGKVTITGCDTAATGELVIPATIEGNPVTSINPLSPPCMTPNPCFHDPSAKSKFLAATHCKACP